MPNQDSSEKALLEGVNRTYISEVVLFSKGGRLCGVPIQTGLEIFHKEAGGTVKCAEDG